MLRKGYYKLKEAKKLFKTWINNVQDKEIMQELVDMKDFPEKIDDKFSENIKFGTAGLRGIMSAGTNRMNIYTVRKVSQGLADYLNEKYDNPSVAISYDSRKNSKKFAFETASVMAGNNIRSYVTQEIQPTPFLSFCVRNLKTSAGVMITASHNPPQYNGYKCYGEDGAQMTEDVAEKVYEKICRVDIFRDVKIMRFEHAVEYGLVSFVEDNVYDNYFKCVMNQRVNNFSLSKLSVVYTPLNGAGNYFVQKVLDSSGLKDLYVVPEQENPDENFETCPYPNPESEEAFKLAKEVAVKKNADIILATDPDSDRVGICVKHGEEYKLLNGNEIGILLCNYVLTEKIKSGNMPENPIIITTIVSSPMVEKIASTFGCEVKKVLTGFKNIASEIRCLEESERESDFILGFEESNGYLTGTYVRDKDAVSAALLLCEAALYYKRMNMDLIDVLDKLKSKYGFFGEKTLSFEFQGIDGVLHIKNIMKKLRHNPEKCFAERKIIKIEDYLQSTVTDESGHVVKSKKLPFSDVIIFYLEGETRVVVRPSGTEPKIKFYLMLKKKNYDELTFETNNLEEFVEKFINQTNV